MDERERPSVQALPILGQPAAAVQPSNRMLDDPAFRQDCEAPRGIRPLDDLHLNLARDLRQPTLDQDALDALAWIESGMPDGKVGHGPDASQLTPEQLAELAPASCVPISESVTVRRRAVQGK